MGNGKITIDELANGFSEKLNGNFDDVNNLKRSTNLISSIDNKYEMNNIPKGNCMVTFMDDDGHKDVYNVLKPLFEKYGKKFSACVITKDIGRDANYMTWDQVRDLNNKGFEIESHGYTNNRKLSECSNAEQLIELQHSKEILVSNGIYPNHFVYQLGDYNNFTLENIQRFYKSGVATKLSAQQHGLVPPLMSCKISRIGLGSWQDLTTAEIKSRILAAKATGSWIIFMTHAWANTSLNPAEGNLAAIEDVLKYCISEGVMVETYDKAYRRYMNKVEIGNNSITNKSYYIVGADYKEYTNMNNLAPQLEASNHVFASTPSSYLKGTCKMYMREVTSAEANSTLGPAVKRAGMLVVNSVNRMEYLRRTFTVFDTSEIYTQYAIDANTWSSWELLNIVKNLKATTITGLELPSFFKGDSIYLKEIPGSAATNFPEKRAGTYTVTRVGTSLGYVKAEYRPHQKEYYWIRTGLDNDTWSDWSKISDSTVINNDIDSITKNPFTQLLEKKKGKILLVSDSLGAGVGGPNYNVNSLNPLIFQDGTDMYYETNKSNGGWQGWLNNYLVDNYPSITFRNISIAGKSSRWWRDKKELAITDLAQDVIIIALGANDRWNTNNTTEYIKYMGELIDYCSSGGAKIMLLCSPFHTLVGESIDYMKYSMYEINRAIHKLAQDRKLFLIDTYSEFMELVDKDRISADKLINADGIHCNKGGYFRMWCKFQKDNNIQDKVIYEQDDIIHISANNTDIKRLYSRGYSNNPFQKISDAIEILSVLPKQKFKLLIDNSISYTNHGLLTIKDMDLEINVSDTTKNLVIDGIEFINCNITGNARLQARINGVTVTNSIAELDVLINETGSKKGLVINSGYVSLRNMEIEKSVTNMIIINSGVLDIINISRYELINTLGIKIASKGVLKIGADLYSKIRAPHTIEGRIEFSNTLDVLINKDGITATSTPTSYVMGKNNICYYSPTSNGGFSFAANGSRVETDLRYGALSTLIKQTVYPNKSNDIYTRWWNSELSTPQWGSWFKISAVAI